MNVLIVYAHPEPTSFNGALRDISVEVLQSQQHSVVISDLYRMRFDPVLGAGDFVGKRVNAARLNIGAEQKKACEEGTLAAELLIEQEKLARAELVIFHFPVWWFGMPAILKGWADRVFARGFAYDGGRKYDTGMFVGKTAMLVVTTGTSAETYRPDGIDGDILNILWPIHNGLFRYCGFDVLEPFVAYMPGRSTPAQTEAELFAYRRRILTLGDTPRLYFHPAADYGPNERLKPGVVARSTFQRN
jgi:NAD(P)H dehydrogenase (quinone)